MADSEAHLALGHPFHLPDNLKMIVITYIYRKFILSKLSRKVWSLYIMGENIDTKKTYNTRSKNYRDHEEEENMSDMKKNIRRNWSLVLLTLFTLLLSEHWLVYLSNTPIMPNFPAVIVLSLFVHSAKTR